MINEMAVHPWLTKPAELGEIISEETCDIAVLGAGVAGCTAAQAAASAGARVICCEKFSTFTAHGTDIGAIGTKVQKAAGVEIDKALAARLIYEWSQQQANYYLIRTFTEKSGEILDYYIDMARQFGLKVTLNDEMTARADWDRLEDKFKQFKSAHLFDVTKSSVLKKGKWNAAYFVEMVYRSALLCGADFRFNTKAERLVKNGSNVTGVIVKDAEGCKKINARRGVIIATGGITDNVEMKRCWCPLALRADKVENFPVSGNMGDGLMMGAWAGAAITRCNPAPIIHPVNFTALGPGMNTSWMTVNKDGYRFASEMAYEPAVTNARMNAPGNVMYAVWDADYRQHLLKQEPLKARRMLEGLEQRVEQNVQSGEYIKADTLRELAVKLGIPSDNLRYSVDRYNAWCVKGVDEDFAVPARFLSPVRTGPFYAFKMTSWLLSLPHGLHVDQNSQVLTEDDEPIGGLFAIGNAQGDFFANSYPVTIPGTSHGRSITFGYLVGRALAHGTTINGYSVF